MPGAGDTWKLDRTGAPWALGPRINFNKAERSRGLARTNGHRRVCRMNPTVVAPAAGWVLWPAAKRPDKRGLRE